MFGSGAKFIDEANVKDNGCLLRESHIASPVSEVGDFGITNLGCWKLVLPPNTEEKLPAFLLLVL